MLRQGHGLVHGFEQSWVDFGDRRHRLIQIVLAGELLNGELEPLQARLDLVELLDHLRLGRRGKKRYFGAFEMQLRFAAVAPCAMGRYEQFDIVFQLRAGCWGGVSLKQKDVEADAL